MQASTAPGYGFPQPRCRPGAVNVGGVAYDSPPPRGRQDDNVVALAGHLDTAGTT